MARNNVSLLHKSPTRKRTGVLRSPNFALKPFKRSPIQSKLRRGKENTHIAAYDRFGQDQGNLSYIREESAEVDDSRGLREDTYRDLHINDMVDREDEDQSDNDDVAEWDEESTLVALLDYERGDTEDDDVSALVNNLKAPITARGVTLKEHLVHTIIPTAKKVKKTHATLESTVDPLFEEGLLAFNDASRDMENMAIRDEDELKTVHGNVQVAIKKLFSQLEEAYERRDKIYTEFNAALEQSVHRAKADLDALPGDIERVVTAQDKRSKELEKGGSASAKSKEKMLRELLKF